MLEYQSKLHCFQDGTSFFLENVVLMNIAARARVRGQIRVRKVKPTIGVSEVHIENL